MKLGILLVIIGGIVVFWWLLLPLVAIIDGGVVDWKSFGVGLAIAFLGGAFPIVIGQERIRKTHRRG